MTKHTATAGPLPNGSINFEKVQAAARDGSDDIYDGAVKHERQEPEATAGEVEDKTADVVVQAPVEGAPDKR